MLDVLDVDEISYKIGLSQVRIILLVFLSEKFLSLHCVVHSGFHHVIDQRTCIGHLQKNLIRILLLAIYLHGT